MGRIDVTNASNARAVRGRIERDVNEIDNTGTFRADLELPEGPNVVTINELREFAPRQNGGVAAFLYEHGDTGW